MSAKRNLEEADVADQDFIRKLRAAYADHPSYVSVARPTPSTRPSSRRVVMGVVLLVALVAIGGQALIRLSDESPEAATTGETPSTAATADQPRRSTPVEPDGEPSRLLVPDLAATWPSRQLDSCADYRPRAKREVIYVDRFTEECASRAAWARTVIFSSTKSGTLGGVGWAGASRPWGRVDGRVVYEKVRGFEVKFSGILIRGVWTKAPREYAVFVGTDSLIALQDLLPPEHDGATRHSEPVTESD